MVSTLEASNNNLCLRNNVLVLTTGKTTTTRMLPVLANTTLTGRDVATAIEKRSQ